MPPDAIPIHAASAGLTGNAAPLLREIHDMVGHLLRTGEASSIDLSAMPLTPADLDWLREVLGTGEIAAFLQAEGESTLAETACAGVWWVTHRNAQAAVTSQFIEVAFVPELIKAHPEDIAIGMERLESLMAEP